MMSPMKFLLQKTDGSKPLRLAGTVFLIYGVIELITNIAVFSMTNSIYAQVVISDLSSQSQILSTVFFNYAQSIIHITVGVLGFVYAKHPEYYTQALLTGMVLISFTSFTAITFTNYIYKAVELTSMIFVFCYYYGALKNQEYVRDQKLLQNQPKDIQCEDNKS